MPDKRRVIPEDLFELAVPLDPRVSPDGTRVVFALRTVDPATRKNRVHLWVGAPGAPARALTDGPHKDTSPRWSPDGKRIAFFTNRMKDRTQVAVIAASGGEPEI